MDKHGSMCLNDGGQHVGRDHIMSHHQITYTRSADHIITSSINLALPSGKLATKGDWTLWMDIQLEVISFQHY